MKSTVTHLVFVCTACAAALVSYGVWYAIVSEKSMAVAVLQSQIDAKTATVDRVATARAAFAEMAGDEATIQSYFVPEAGVVAFIDSLESRGAALGTAVRVLSVSANKTPPSFVLTIEVEGTFDAVLRTVGAIEYAPYNLSIPSLSVDQDAKGGWHANIKLVVGSVLASATTAKP